MTRILAGKPREHSYSMPAEWAPHSATWMSWPFDEEMWHGHLTEVRQEYTQLVKTITRFEPVHLLLRDAEARTTAHRALEGTPGLSFHDIPLDDVWMRDNGPLFVTRPSATDTHPALSFVNWEFNSWGQKYDWDNDNKVPKAMADWLNMPHFDSSFVMEGGSLEINGLGACITTEQCLLSPYRNPKLDKKGIEAALLEYLGIDQVVWLKLGLEGDHTDGHVDTITRFAHSHTVLSSICSDKTDVNFERMQENWDILKSVRLKDGRPLELVALPLPENRLELADGTRLPPTYANFYFVNGAVLVPQYNDPNDIKALDILKRVFPDRQVIGLPSRYIITGGGSFHCLTQQQPKVEA